MSFIADSGQTSQHEDGGCQGGGAVTVSAQHSRQSAVGIVIHWLSKSLMSN